MLYAARGADWRTLEYTLSKMRANPNSEESARLPPLHSAVKYVERLSHRSVEAHKRCIKVLLDHGADVNMRDSNDETALLLAADRWCPEIFEVMIEYGATITDVDEQTGGRNVFEYLADQPTRDERIVDFLKERYAEEFVEWWAAAEDKKWETCMMPRATVERVERTSATLRW